MDGGVEDVFMGDEDKQEGARRRASLTLTGMNVLAATFSKQGRWAKAEKVQVQVIEATRRVLRENHSWTMTSMANLASSYKNQGRWTEAKNIGPRRLGFRMRSSSQASQIQATIV